MNLNRRSFMVGCSAAIAAMAGSRLNYIALGSANDEPDQEKLVVIFLRGGVDGLSIVAPMEGADRGAYEDKRDRLVIPTSGENGLLRLDDRFGLHPAGAPIMDLYQQGNFGFIHAAGLTNDTRSHFDAMQYMELGTPESKSTSSGWLARYLQTIETPQSVIMPAVAAGNLQPTSLIGSREAIGMTSPKSFNFGGDGKYAPGQRQGLRRMYNGDSWLHEAGLQTLDAIDVIEAANPGDYTPENGADYPNGSFSSNLKTVAQVIKLQLGLRVATIDIGGWDTHDYQGDEGGGYFANKIGEVTQALRAFYADLNTSGNDYTQKLTVVVMSEFGRTVQENGSRGTDHGHGNVMMVMGGNVKGGQVAGPWPGLTGDDLYQGRDLAITTDYRQVLSEVLIRRLANPNLGTIFPNYRDYQPLGIVEGADLPPNYDATEPVPVTTPEPIPTPGPGGTIPIDPVDPVDPTNPTMPTPPGSGNPSDPSNPEMGERVFLPLVDSN